MRSNLYIPKKIKVGFQKRSDTFTGKLGFVTYVDDKGQLRQEKSWEGWRDKKIEAVEFDNEPRSNFVFNKDVNRSGHWSDVTKVRIYDTRDFEFEIDVSNMMYILMHSDISKRDIAEDCVFAWSGKNLILLPVNSEEYRNSVVNTRKQDAVFSLKTLVLGHTYSTKNQGDAVYLGHHEWSGFNYSGNAKVRQSLGKKHIFYMIKGYGDKFVILESKDLAEEVSSEVHQNYANWIEALYKHDNMKKSGKFTVTKGFEKEGFKKTAYEMLKVTVHDRDDNNRHYVPFTLQKVIYNANNDIPKITHLKDMDHWSARQYETEMRDKKVNLNDPNQIKDYFEQKGFGVLYYKNTNGEKIVVK